ncbi:MAG: hypothetical protein JSS93_05285 [Bacteroidetes bacterium]|nr:hypothetical protein [Bacteroidota bacterium]
MSKGYALQQCVYVSNEHAYQMDVYFDDVTMTRIPSPVVQQEDFYPGGATFNSYSRENAVPNKYFYNSKEYQDDLNLNLYNVHARQYDPWTLRTTTLDPHADRYHNLSSYSWCGNNPAVNIDPTGKDVVFDITRNKKTGEITGVTLRSTVYITGEGASQERADDLNKASGDVFQSRTLKNGVKVSFDIKYQYKKDFNMKDLKAGNNVLNFVNKPSNYDAHDVSRTHAYKLEGSEIVYPGNTGEIHKDQWNNPLAIFHETLHFTGLDDRYDSKGNALPGFKNDIMGNRESSKIGIDHFQSYFDRANNPYLSQIRPNGFVSTVLIDSRDTPPSKQQSDEQN